MKFTLNKMNNLAQRIIVAIIGVFLILGFIYWGPWTFFVTFFIICAMTLREFYKLIGLDGFLPLVFWGVFTGMAIFCISFLIQIKLINNEFLFLIFPISAIIFFIKLYKKSDVKPFTNIAYTFLGIVYVAVPFALLNVIAFSAGNYHFEIVMGVLFLTWASDTGGYFAGTMFGKTKLFERISPMKSWEGFVGGAILTFLVAIGLSAFFDIFPLWKWIIMGILTVVAGTYGDLVESLFKRGIKIKDSGKILPGHGGFLDRFDALILSLPFIAAFLKVF